MGSRPEARVAARQEAIKMGKEKRKLEDAKKKAEKAKVCVFFSMMMLITSLLLQPPVVRLKRSLNNKPRVPVLPLLQSPDRMLLHC
jgi:hypothetical protein